MKKILTFTATYNEMGNIQNLLEKIKFYLPTTDLLVIDDNSPDGTGNILDELANSWPFLKIIHRPSKMGVGSAHKMAMIYALAHNYDILVTMDADFSHNPKYLPKLIEGMNENEFVIGSRYANGGKCDYGFWRSALSKMANHLTRALLGVKLKETTTSLRAFSSSLLKKVPLSSINSEGYSFFIESTYIVSKLSKKLEEVPIHFEDRRFGTSKINKKEIIKGLITLLKLFFRRPFQI